MDGKQIGLSTILLLIAALSIAGGAYAISIEILNNHNGVQQSPARYVAAAMGVAIHAPFWLPFAFLGFVIGRRRIAVTTVVVFLFAEILSVGGMAALLAGI